MHPYLFDLIHTIKCLTYSCIMHVWNDPSCHAPLIWALFFQVSIKAYYLLLSRLCTPERLLVDSQCNTCAKIRSNSYSSLSSLSLDLQNEHFLDMPPSELPEHCFLSVIIVFDFENLCINVLQFGESGVSAAVSWKKKKSEDDFLDS